MHSLDWNDLRYFLAIGEAGTLAGAARILGVQHSTVGRRLGAVEGALGVSLFTRTPDGLILTDAGREILPLAQEAGRALAAIELRVGGGDKRIEGNVRLATSEAFSGLMIRILSELKERHPALTVDILSGNRPLDLTRGEADIAVRLMATPQPDLISRKIGESGWSLYASESYLRRSGILRDASELAGLDLIDFDEAMASVPGAQWLRKHGKGARVVLRGNSIIAVLNAAVAGMGVAGLPCVIADVEPGLRRLTPAIIGSRDVCLVYMPAAARIARVRAVIDFIAESLSRRSALLRGDAGAGGAGD
ncbi:MAG TPA: LysR family transcriptional regulator [Bauldia sp.]|nr:LysR family transcriptional regulator [Bauldia sp.]